MSDPLTTALIWIEQVLLGSAALIIATLAVAAIGFAMLQGRVSIQRGARVILGCFVLLSARAIASAFVMATPLDVNGAGGGGLPPAPAYTPTISKPENKDPYAGAASPPPAAHDPI